MSLEIPDPGTNGQVILPAQAGRFTEVAGLLRDGEPAKAFGRAAEVMLEKFEILSAKMQPYAVLKLAIEMHKHALFCEVAQDKAKTQHDAAAFAAYQAYLAGETDVPVAMGLPNLGTQRTAAGEIQVNVDFDPDAAEAEESQDGQ